MISQFAEPEDLLRGRLSEEACSGNEDLANISHMLPRGMGQK
jgi:hypothetical protein